MIITQIQMIKKIPRALVQSIQFCDFVVAWLSYELHKTRHSKRGMLMNWSYSINDMWFPPVLIIEST
jgi:hypothetical protein